MRYYESILYFLLPPIAVLYAIYRPLLGRRDALKILWLIGVFVIASGGWSYPPGSILATIIYIPLEEHAFFILQPIIILLLHALVTLPVLVPFTVPRQPQTTVVVDVVDVVDTVDEGASPKRQRHGAPTVGVRTAVQTLPRRPLAAIPWVLVMAAGAALAVESHTGRVPGLALGTHAFYMGYILVWIAPVIAFLTYLGARLGRRDVLTVVLATGYLWMVDTSGAWSISEPTSLNIHLWRGLPLEEATFFVLTTYLIVLASALISHLHALLVLAPPPLADADAGAITASPCPPRAVLPHIALLARLALAPPTVDAGVLAGLAAAQDTLREGSKSFDLAKLAFGREIRIGLVAVYAWCRVTDNLIDETPADSPATRLAILGAIRAHLRAAYDPAATPAVLDGALAPIRALAPADRSAFHLFASLVPRLAPIEPFLELCDGYETDLAFYAAAATAPAAAGDASTAIDIDRLPIKTSRDLERYADNVAGSVAAAICHVAWAILTSPADAPPARKAGAAAADVGGTRARTIDAARQMGRALQLVNIARDVVKDAAHGRVYVPLSRFPTPAHLLSLVGRRAAAGHGGSDDDAAHLAALTLPLLEQAERMRVAAEGEIAHVPCGARGGMRAMVASYFEIAHAVRRQRGVVDVRGVKVGKGRRIAAAAKAMWLG